MNGKKAREIRKEIYGDKTGRYRTYYKEGKTINSDNLRKRYKKAKKRTHTQ